MMRVFMIFLDLFGHMIFGRQDAFAIYMKTTFFFSSRTEIFRAYFIYLQGNTCVLCQGFSFGRN